MTTTKYKIWVPSWLAKRMQGWGDDIDYAAPTPGETRTGEVVAETQKGILFRDEDDQEYWFPKSRVCVDEITAQTHFKNVYQEGIDETTKKAGSISDLLMYQ